MGSAREVVSSDEMFRMTEQEVVTWVDQALQTLKGECDHALGKA